MPKTSDIIARNVRENFAPLSKENCEATNNNTTEFDGNNIVNTLITLLCGLCNKSNTDELLGIDEQNNATHGLMDHGATDGPKNTGELLRTFKTHSFHLLISLEIEFFNCGVGQYQAFA